MLFVFNERAQRTVFDSRSDLSAHCSFVLEDIALFSLIEMLVDSTISDPWVILKPGFFPQVISLGFLPNNIPAVQSLDSMR